MSAETPAVTFLELDHDPAVVTRPDGATVTVYGGRYALEGPGTYTVGPLETVAPLEVTLETVTVIGDGRVELPTEPEPEPEAELEAELEPVVELEA